MKILGRMMLFFIVIGFFSCVETYEKTFQTSKNIIIVEGLLCDDFGLKPIYLKESEPSETGSSRILPIKGANVFIIVDSKDKIQLTEKDEGAYYFSESFKGEKGKKYKLQFTTSDGNLFESIEEELPNAVPINKISHKLDLNAITDAKGNFSAGFKFFVDINDPINVKNNYLWSWKIYEKQSVCKTCTGGYYYKTPAPLGSCVEDQILKRYNNIFDYNCDSNCWDIFTSSDLPVFTDELSDGKTLSSQYVGKVPVYQYTPALVEITQYSISKSAYNFINLSQQQGVQTGGLADTPPAQLIGNVKCLTDPLINTSGFFVVAGKNTSKYWLDKSDAFELKVNTIGLFGGRELKLEPAGPNTTRPPLAPCVNSLIRTNQKPEGWLN